MTLQASDLPVVEKPQKSAIVESPMSEPLTTSSYPSSHDPSERKAAQARLYPNYAQPELVMVRGQGATLFDADDRRYIDFYAGIAVSALGHAHPRLVQAISAQAARVLHLSNYFYNEPNLQLAKKLCELCNMDRAFFCNSGTEANEAVLKLARRYFFNQGQSERNVVLAFENSFHGRTLGSLTVTGQAKYREGFGPVSGAVFARYGDLEQVSSLMSDKIAAILVEPIQGEGGVVVPPPGFIRGLRELCDRSGALLLFDEIQTGVARTGLFLGGEHEGVSPDALSLAKGLGGGVPIGAMLCKERYSGVLVPGSHGTTFGGNPLASAAALAVLSVIDEQDLLSRVADLGRTLEDRLQKLVEAHSCLTERRGRGLLQGLVVRDPSQGPQMLSALREAGLLLTFAGGCALRITPPLTISDSELDSGLLILDQILGNFS